MRLNLGAGGSPIEGFDNSWDVKEGKKAYPLALSDGVADEIRASHLLEHFSHRGAAKVVSEWVRVLKPGGLLRLAVPDLEVIARKYLAGEEGQYQGWLSGGQVEPYDSHLAQYDWDSLAALMRKCGLVGIHKWDGHDDCSQLEVSLNMGGYKRPARWPKVLAVMSRPRLGFMDQFGCAMDALLPMGISIISRTGVYWGKCMTIAIEAALEQGAEWILTLDYDTIFTREDVEDLFAFAAANPDADALVPMQIGRFKDRLLMNPKGDARGVTEDELDQNYYPILTGHFGCTLFRASAFAKLKKPWFYPTFKDDGDWKYDEDINFWLAFEKTGLKAFLAPRVAVGHLEAVVMWPDRKVQMRYQRTNDFREQGKPRDVWR
jgi:SAM-dependent methyltransferase